MQQRYQSLDVVALEGVHVPVEERGVGAVQGLGASLGGQVPECAPRPLQGAVDGGHARAEELGCLGRLPAEHVAQDQRRALAGRKVLERGDEGQADGLAVLGDLGRVRALGGDPVVGNRGQPRGFGQQWSEEGFIRRGRRAHLHGPRPALDVAVHVDAHVGGNAVEPGPDAGSALEPADAAPRPQEGVLHGVLGLEARTEHAVAVAGQLPAVLLQLILSR